MSNLDYNGFANIDTAEIFYLDGFPADGDASVIAVQPDVLGVAAALVPADGDAAGEHNQEVVPRLLARAVVRVQEGVARPNSLFVKLNYKIYIFDEPFHA